MNRQYHSYEEITSIPDKLRWCRHHLGLMQREVADRIGLSRQIYMDIETGVSVHMERSLAKLFEINPTDLLDDYNRFLYEGQGKQLLAYRQQLGMSKKAFARFLGVDVRTIRNWESEQKTMSRKTWEKVMKENFKPNQE